MASITLTGKSTQATCALVTAVALCSWPGHASAEDTGHASGSDTLHDASPSIPKPYDPISTTGHVLATIGSMALVAGSIMSPFVIFEGFAGGCDGDCMPDSVFRAYMSLETIGLVLSTTGIPLLMASHYMARNALHLETDRTMRRLDRGVWAMYVMSGLLCVVGLQPFPFTSALFMPLSALLSSTTLIVAEVAWRRVDRVVDRQSSTAGSMRVLPLVFPVRGGVLVGAGGNF